MANKYFIGGAYSSNSNWSLTDGGINDTTRPGATDDVFFTASSDDCTSVTAPSPCKNLNFTGYTKSVTFTSTAISVSGDVIISPTMTLIPGTGPMFILNAACSFTSNGKYIPGTITSVAATSSINIVGTLSVDAINVVGPMTWLGSEFNTNSYTINTAGAAQIFKTGNIYRIGSLISNSSTGTSHGVIKSDVGGTKATLIITTVCSIGYTDFTDIDNSQGRPIYTFLGTVSNCNNINTMADYVAPINSTTSAMLI